MEIMHTQCREMSMCTVSPSVHKQLEGRKKNVAVNKSITYAVFLDERKAFLRRNEVIDCISKEIREGLSYITVKNITLQD